jgi:hypothetical protein
MNRVILAAAAASAALLSTSAGAQRYRHQPYQPYQQYDVYDQYANGGYGQYGLVIRPHAGEFQQRIHAGVQRGLFDPQEANRMMGDLQSHLALEQQYSSHGITRSEAQVLHERLQYFQWALSQAERTGSYMQPRNPYRY